MERVEKKKRIQGENWKIPDEDGKEGDMRMKSEEEWSWAEQRKRERRESVRRASARVRVFRVYRVSSESLFYGDFNYPTPYILRWYDFWTISHNNLPTNNVIELTSHSLEVIQACIL